MSEPELVAHLLVPHRHRRAILVDGAGADARLPVLLPTLDPGDTLVTALQRHLRAEWGSEPVFLETHLPPPATPDGGYVALAVLDAPPDAWTPPVELRWERITPALPEPIAGRARTWMDELATDSDPPTLRPSWARPGWQARARRWISDRLAEAGRVPTGPFENRRLWGISALIRVPTSEGDAWFKSVFTQFHHEPAVTAFLAEVLPGLVPPVIATHPDEGWLLLESAGSPLEEGHDADAAILRSIDLLTDAQAATRHLHERFTSLGCARRPLHRLADDLRRALGEAEELGGARVSADRAFRVAGWVEERSRWLDGLGMPDAVVHGDFHPGNLLQGAFGLKIIDWSDAAIAHPVMEIAPWFGEVRPELRPAGWSAWLQAWARFADVAELRRHERDAYALACAYQVVSYAGILRNLEPANRYQVSDGFRGYWQDLDARVPS